MHSRFVFATVCSLGLLLLACFLVGCGGAQGNRVTGKITFKGQPVPAGKVYISPDSSQGNSGATGYADIKDGTYDTSAAGGRGAVSGPVVISIEGMDPNPPPGAEPDVTVSVLFAHYEMKADLPEGEAVQDIDVPAEAANPPVQQERMIIEP